MPEFWELCDLKSRAKLGYLFKQEYGYWPDWDDRSGKMIKRQSVTMSPDVEEEYMAEIARFMSEAPKHQRRIE
uniref:Uncharacterized protein n=1 Tax=viral metagenome TaxID=1070528 RepID=A0A6M3LTT2_9ZZZZ